MKRWRLSIGISLVLLLVASLIGPLLVTGCTPGAGPEEPTPTEEPGKEVYHLVYETIYPPREPGTDMLGVACYDWIADLEAASDGRIKVDPYFANQLVPMTEAFIALSQEGTLDLLFAGSYWEGVMPEQDWGLMAFINAGEDYVTYLYGETEFGKLYEEACNDANAHHVFPATVGGELFWSTKPFYSIEDLKGTLCCPASQGHNWCYEAVGMVPVPIVGAEIYTGLQRGTVDAVLYPQYSGWKFHYDEVTDYLLQPPWHDPIEIMTWMNLDKYNNMPDDLRDIFDEVTNEYKAYILPNGSKHFAAMSYFWNEQLGMETIYWPQEEVDELRNTMIEKAWPKWGEQSPRCKQMMDIAITTMKSWKDINPEAWEEYTTRFSSDEAYKEWATRLCDPGCLSEWKAKYIAPDYQGPPEGWEPLS